VRRGGQEKLDPKDVFNYFVNKAPDQQTVTVRTEEAILLSLGILNLAAKLAG
jgi:predicted SPOUT superfamily RNA methylase MTH1